jgi:hypothetical protein
MSQDLDRNELRALFAALHEATISPEDHARLESILAASTEARRLWFLHCDIETGMAEWAAARREGSGQPIASFPSSERSPARFGWPWLAPLAAAAAVLILAAGWLFHERGKDSAAATAAAVEPRANGVAVLARSVGVEWADGVERASGTVLEPGILRLKSGAALVEFYRGARVVLEGPAEFQIVSAGEAFLRSGKINAHVPAQARGFTVDSPDLKVVDHGTDFGFIVSREAAPEVHVFTGNVEVASAKLAPRALTEGQAVRLDGSSLLAIPAAHAAFLSEEELTRRDAADALQRFTAWQSLSRALSAESATVLHYTFNDADALGNRITNQSASAAPQSHGTIVGSAWAEGRWAGKRALEFRGGGDRVRFIAPPLPGAVTLLAWVRVESLPHWQNVLLAADSDQPGALHWHLTQRGELRFEIARDLGRPQSDWEAVNSAPFVTSDRFGQWLMLATTFDGQTIRHYGNGRPIGAGASFTPSALTIGTAELGNWSGGTERHLAAALDEFAILSRALSATEIQALYEAGKP